MVHRPRIVLATRLQLEHHASLTWVALVVLQDYYKKMFGMKRLRYRDQPDVGSVCWGCVAVQLALDCFHAVMSRR